MPHQQTGLLTASQTSPILIISLLTSSETTARTMIVWPDKETAHKALSMVRDDAEAATAQKITSTCEGNIVAGF
jgi:hypothetical protein